MDAGKLARLLSRADWKGAEALLRRAAGRPGATAAVFYNLAKVLEVQGRSHQMRPWLQKAVESDPNHADAWFELGRALMATDFPGAEAAFARSVALKPDADCWRNLARLRLRLQDWDGCLEALRHLPEDAETLPMAYRVACETGAVATDLRDRMLCDPALRPEALKALTRVAHGTLPLKLP